MKKKGIHDGYIATLTVLVLMAVTLSVMVTVSLLGIGEAQGILAVVKGEETLALTEGCVEDMLLKVRNSPTYAGGAITRPEGTCSVTIESKVGNNWTVQVVNSATDYVRRVRIKFTRTGKISLAEWQEI